MMMMINDVVFKFDIIYKCLLINSTHGIIMK
jgi:hypothetical protein